MTIERGCGRAEIGLVTVVQFVQATLVQAVQACIKLRKFYICLWGVPCKFGRNSHIYKENPCLREAGVVSSNLATPTKSIQTSRSSPRFRMREVPDAIAPDHAAASGRSDVWPPLAQILDVPTWQFREGGPLHATLPADIVRRRLTEIDADVPPTFQIPGTTGSKQLTTGHRVWHCRQYIRFRSIASEEIGNAVRVRRNMDPKPQLPPQL
jgi:hypothetical protein